MTDKIGIYIHVPFCRSKCYYCDFCSRTRADEETKALYVKRLCEEIRNAPRRYGGALPAADTVYFGGGTPTLLTADQLGEVLEAVDRALGIERGAEISAETNPKASDGDVLRELRSVGINRLSIGMQSVHDGELRALGRIHTFSHFLDTYLAARKAGFDNISVDLMYGIPEQTRESFLRSVETLAVAGPEHISSYCLTVEDGTPFGRRRDSLVLPDEDTVADMYADMCGSLAKYGYNKYEISNFSKEGRESLHNLKYWQLDDYLGFGVAAHSCYKSVRYANSRDIDAYLGGDSIVEFVESIDRQGQMNEFVMLGMRLARGVDALEFKERFGEDVLERFPSVNRFAPEYVTVDDYGFRFTEKGMFVSNHILSEVLDI